MAQGFTINSVFVSGNLTRDPEQTFTPSGFAITKFGVAVNNRKKVGDNWENDPCYLDIVTFGKTAEQLADQLSKGMPVMIEGHLQYRQWETQDGQKRNKLEVVGDVVKPLVKYDGGKKDSVEYEDDMERTHGGRPVRKMNSREDSAPPF